MRFPLLICRLETRANTAKCEIKMYFGTPFFTCPPLRKQCLYTNHSSACSKKSTYLAFRQSFRLRAWLGAVSSRDRTVPLAPLLRHAALNSAQSKTRWRHSQHDTSAWNRWHFWSYHKTCRIEARQMSAHAGPRKTVKYRETKLIFGRKRT